MTRACGTLRSTWLVFAAGAVVRALPQRELRAFRFVDGLVYYPHIGEYNEMQLVNGRWQKSQYRVVAGISRI